MVVGKRVGIGGTDMLFLVARADLEGDRAQAVFLEREEPGVTGHRRRQERLLAFCVELESADLHAEHATPGADRMIGTEADLVADLRIAGADLAVAFDLDMLIIVAGGAQAQRVHRA